MKRTIYGIILSFLLLGILAGAAYGVGIVSETTLLPSQLTRDPWGCVKDEGTGKCESWSYFAKSWLGTVYGRETGLACQTYKFSSYYSCFRGTFEGNQLTIGYYKGLGIGTCWNSDQDYDTVNRHMRVWIDGVPVSSVHQGKTADGLAESKSGNGDTTVYETTYPLSTPGTHTLVLCPAESSYYYGMGYMNFVYLKAQLVDSTPPTNPNVVSEGGGAQSGVWTNVSAPVFSWSGATDDLAGVRGYDVYFGSDPNGAEVQVSLPDNGSGGYTGFSPAGPLADGQYYLRVRTWDNADNAADWTTLFTLLLDTAPPTVSGDPPADWQTQAHVEFPVEASDALSGVTLVEYSTDGGGSYTPLSTPGGMPAVSETLALDYPDGTHDILLRAVDAAGNAGQQSVTVRVDTTPPELVVQSAAWNQDDGQITLTGQVADAVSGIRTFWGRVDDGSWQEVTLNGGSFTFAAANSAYGDSLVTLRVEDNAGNVTTAARQLHRDEPTPTPTPTATTVFSAVLSLFSPPTATPLPSPTPTPTLSPTPTTRVRATDEPLEPTPTLSMPQMVATVLPTMMANLPPEPPPPQTSTLWPLVLLTAGGIFVAFSTNVATDRRPEEIHKLGQLISMHRKEK